MPLTSHATPSLPSHYWAHWTTLDFTKASGLLDHTIAVLPVAATEQHGPHLPLSVDTALLDAIVAAALPHLGTEVPAVFLPTQAVGLSPEHAQFAGTLTLKPETIIRLWTDIGESVAAAGIKKLLIFNAHGGQVSVMDIVARDLRSRFQLLTVRANWFDLPLIGANGEDVNALFSAHEHRFGIHAGEIETSMMLAIAPQLVDLAKAQNFASTSAERAKKFPILGNGKSAKLGWQMQDYNANGAVGNAVAATAEKGRLLLDAAGRALAQLLAEIHQLPILDASS